MNLFKIEIKRAIFNKNMLIVLLIGIVIVLPHTIQNLLNEIEIKNYIAEAGLSSGADLTSLYGRWFGMSTDFLAIMFYYILPLLAVYPGAMIYYKDRKSGYVKNLYTRFSKNKCLIIKYITTFISGGVAVVIPLLTAFLLTSLYAPARIPDSLVMNPVVDINMWSELFFTHPLLYTLGYMLIDFIFGGLFACLAMSVSEFVKHKFSVFISSFLVVAALSFVCVQLNLDYLNPQNFLSPAQFVTAANGYVVLIEALILFVVSFSLFYIGGKINETF